MPKDEKYDSPEVESVTDECYEYCVKVIEEMKSSGVEPIVRLEERLDFTNYVPDGFGTGDFIAIGSLPDGRKCLQVVDYKFGRPEAEHRDQVARYEDLYRRMGYGEVSGFLWYVESGEVVSV